MPARAKQIIRAVKAAYGCTVEEPKSGSHWKIRTAGGVVYPLPLHNGDKTEVDDKYLKGLCKVLGCTLQELKKQL